MAGLALQVADVLGYKPSAEERQDINLRELTAERGRTKDPKAQKVLDDEIAQVTGTPKIGDQVTAELMGAAPRQTPSAHPTAAQPAQTPAQPVQNAPQQPESDNPAIDAGDVLRASAKGPLGGLELAYKGATRGDQPLAETGKAIASGVGATVAGGLRGLYELAASGGDVDKAAQAVRETQEALTHQPKGKTAQKAVEIVGGPANPLNWPALAGEKAADVGFEKGVLNAGEAAALKAGSTLIAPGAVLKGVQYFKRGAKPVAGEASPFGSVGSASATNATAVKAAAETASPELRAAIEKIPASDINAAAAERQLKADSLPVPIRMSAGQATGDVQLISNERNMRGKNREYADLFNEQDTKLTQNLDTIRDQAAPDVFGTTHVESGQALIDHYRDIDKGIRADITAKYKALEDANGGKFPVDGVAFVDAAEKALGKKLKTDFVPTAIARQMERFKNGEPMTFEQFEAMRTNLAAEMRKAERSGDGNAAAAAGIVREALENVPLTGEAAALKGVADAARSAAKARFDLIKKDPAYKAVVEDNIAPDNFINKFVVNGKAADIKTMVSHLGEGSVAHQTMAAGVINHIKSKTMTTKGEFSDAGYNRAMTKLDPYLNDIVGAKVAGDLRKLGEVSTDLNKQPKGSWVNNSNTFVAKAAEGAKNIAEFAANKAIPYAQVGSRVRQFAANRAEAKTVERSLKPGAGISLKDIKDMK